MGHEQVHWFPEPEVLCGGGEIRLEMYWVTAFPKYDNNPKILQGVIENCKAKINVSELAVIKSMVDKRLDYLSIISIENDITKYLSCEKTVKEHGAKMHGERSIINVCYAIFWI